MEKRNGKIFFEKPISVSDYISVLNKLLSSVDAKIIGEVSGMKTAASGHVYFSLKDEKKGDVINCAIWSSIYRMCGVKIEDGMQVILSGSADIYPVRGSLTFKVKTVEPVGEGALKKAYDALKEKLTKEGVFKKERKRTLPIFPQNIGLITSKKGAAVHDFINNLGKFGFNVYICDSRVEGQEAVRDLLHSLRIMRKKDIQLLAVVRGGGSLESLIAFDNEMVVREIANFPVPVVAGIGHHEDVPLASLVADAAESTPTAAANRISLGFQEAKENVSRSERKIERRYRESIYKKKEVLYRRTEDVKKIFQEIIEKYKKSEEKIMRVLSLVLYNIRMKRKKMINILKEVFFSFQIVVERDKEKIERIEDILKANNPEKQLSLGYAIMRKNGKVVKRVSFLKKGDKTETLLFDGKLESEIKRIKNLKNKKYGAEEKKS